jgi:hypothetical protein
MARTAPCDTQPLRPRHALMRCHARPTACRRRQARSMAGSWPRCPATRSTPETMPWPPGAGPARPRTGCWPGGHTASKRPCTQSTGTPRCASVRTARSSTAGPHKAPVQQVVRLDAVPGPQAPASVAPVHGPGQPGTVCLPLRRRSAAQVPRMADTDTAKARTQRPGHLAMQQRAAHAPGGALAVSSNAQRRATRNAATPGVPV